MNFLVDILLKLWISVSLLFKKSSQVQPVAKETEKPFIKQEEDNYYAQTMGKSFRQHQYEQTWKKMTPEQQENAKSQQKERFKQMTIK